MTEEKRVKTKIKPDICPLCKKPTEVIGIGVYECNTCKNKWFEEGLILEERYVEAYGKSEELLAKLQEKDKEVKKEEKKEEKKEPKKKDEEREEWLTGRTKRVKTGCSSLYITINHDDENRIIEVFLASAPPGGCGSALTSAIGLGLSMYLQAGGNLKKYMKKLAGAHCPKASLSSKSCPAALIEAIEEESALLKGEKRERTKIDTTPAQTCPDCGNYLIFAEGCKKCSNPSCGWSDCS